ncbi:MAG: EF-hand domain-containing protein [Planctomycetota bacterium]
MSTKVIAIGIAITVGGVATIASLIPNREPEPIEFEPETPSESKALRPRSPVSTPSSDEFVAQRPAVRSSVPQRSTDTPVRGRMARFDTDGDGNISPAEFSFMWQEREDRRQQWQARFDLDGDGTVTDDERREAWQEMRTRMRERFVERLTPRFDADGDGVLNDEEAAALDEYLNAREAERDERLLADFDADGNGQLSDSERELAFEQRRMNRMSQQEQLVERFDEDANGQLDMDESYEAFQVSTETREQLRFIRDHDADGDGALGAADLEAFMTAYSDGNESADADGDGAVTNEDLRVFRDRMMADPVDPDTAELFSRRGRGGGGGDRGGNRP